MLIRKKYYKIELLVVLVVEVLPFIKINYKILKKKDKNITFYDYQNE